MYPVYDFMIIIIITLEGQIQGKKVVENTKNNVLGLVIKNGGRQY